MHFIPFGEHSEPFGGLTKFGAKRVELVQKFVPRSRIGIFRNQRTRSTQLDPKLTFCCISYYFGAFGTFLLPYETRCTKDQSSINVRATKSCRNFSQRTHPITALDPNLTFRCISYYFGAFGTVWSPQETRCKISRTGAKVHAMKSLWNILQQTPPIHPS